jgi:DNA-binding IclR family transcriptional regulator
MSLAEEGILRIADLVQQSGVSNSATRRYLQKAGYTIMEGTVSH